MLLCSSFTLCIVLKIDFLSSVGYYISIFVQAITFAPKSVLSMLTAGGGHDIDHALKILKQTANS